MVKALGIVLASLVLLSCNLAGNSKIDVKPQLPPGKIMPTPTLSISGDFDGNGKIETLTSYIADSTGTRLAKAYDPFNWSDTVEYYSKMGYQTLVSLDKGKNDTLNYFAYGLYCLINLGDINNDEKDEIAIVPALLDFSNLNTCRIYTLCQGKWQEVETVAVNESAFYYAGSSEPIYDHIPEYLENQNGKWMYSDNTEILEADEEVPFKILLVNSCE